MTKAILTGHSRGLGSAIAAALLQRGIPTLGLARRANAELGQAHRDLLIQVEIDLGDDAALADWLDGSSLRHFLKDAGTILLINNAGIVQPVGPSETQAPAAIAQAVRLNVAAPLMLFAAAAAARGKAELRAAHISSGAGRKAYAGWNVYCATKAALDHHARAVVEDKGHGIRICSLAPGVIDTEMQAEIRGSAAEKFPLLADFVAMKRDGALAKPADTAAKIVHYLLSDPFGREPVADIRQVSI
ncbi:MAG TPA: SDR family oxidoreductase [Dongiaceae bacterium]|nr:SDR family oxidoreductase [Dongiaceae bacterium]